MTFKLNVAFHFPYLYKRIESYRYSHSTWCCWYIGNTNLSLKAEKLFKGLVDKFINSNWWIKTHQTTGRVCMLSLQLFAKRLSEKQKCMGQPQKVLWVVFRSCFLAWPQGFGKIWGNITIRKRPGHRSFDKFIAFTRLTFKLF